MRRTVKNTILRPAALALLALILFASCRPADQTDLPTATTPADSPAPASSPTPDPSAPLTAARALWEQSAVSDYRLIVAHGQPTLGCTYEVVDVAGGQVVNAWRGSRLPLCVPRADFTTFDACELVTADAGMTVEDIFERAESYQQPAAATVDPDCAPTTLIETDEQYGLPMLVVSAGPADAECPTDNVSELAVVAFLPGYQPPADAPDPYTACESAAAGAIIQVGEAQGIILPAAMVEGYDLGWMMADTDVTSYWTPTEAEVQAMEAALPAFLQAEEGREGSLIQQRAAEGMWQELDRYTRQYVGVVAGGEQLIWGNYFCHHGGEWQEQLVMVEDGGPCYFSVTFNPATSEFSNLDINGEA